MPRDPAIKNKKNKLHYLFATQSYKKIMSCLGKIKQKNDNQSLRVLDENYNLPVEKLDSREDISKKQFANLMNASIAIIKTQTFKAWRETLDAEELIQKYAIEETSPKAEQMRHLADICNKVRAKIKHSVTHPYTNSLQPSKFKKIDRKIQEMRAKVKGKSLKYRIKQSKLARVGNCDEMAIYAYYLIEKLHPQYEKTYALVKRQKGDHVFVIVNNGDDRLVCDPWAGKIYPISEFDKEFTGYRRFSICFKGEEYSASTLVSSIPFSDVKEYKLSF